MSSKSSLNFLLFITGSMTITLAALFFSVNKDKILPDSTIKISGTVDRIGYYYGTVLTLKDNTTSFYIDKDKVAALTKPGDKVEFTVTTMNKKLGQEETINRASFVNLNLNTLDK